jgi:anti-sigma B factor antagonist
VGDYESEFLGSIPSLDVRRTDHGDAVVLAFAGEIDLANAKQLGAVVEHVQLARPAVLVIDLSAVSFLGSAGLSLLVEACGNAGDGEVRVAAPSDVARRAIKVTALDQVLPLFSSVDDALATRTT